MTTTFPSFVPRWPPIDASLLIALLQVVSWGCDAQQAAENIERPNIILVIGDDHGYRDFGFMGSDTAITPRLDALAAGATLFTHGYSTSSVCQPSLRTLLTGLQPLQFSSRVQLHRRAKSAPANIRRIATLPRILGMEADGLGEIKKKQLQKCKKIYK